MDCALCHKPLEYGEWVVGVWGARAVRDPLERQDTAHFWCMIRVITVTNA